MIIIAAMTENHVIGHRSGLPWHIPEEYQHYLSLIKDQTVMMGRSSFEIFGADLTSAHTLVISRSLTRLEGAEVCASLEDAIQKANTYGKTVFCAGGSSIYQQAVPLADTMYLSFIKGGFEGDAYFPKFDESAWHIERRDNHQDFTFTVFLRKT